MALRNSLDRDTKELSRAGTDSGPVAVETREERIRREVAIVNRAYGSMHSNVIASGASMDDEKDAFAKAVEEDEATSLTDE